jgi:hypothetical protein
MLKPIAGENNDCFFGVPAVKIRNGFSGFFHSEMWNKIYVKFWAAPVFAPVPPAGGKLLMDSVFV